ncbi:conserved hypothetical protein [Planktothrix sp. PCC 11201]|uniref:DUF1822 family protein n=1 Tax=Planktothrix sp. PCC 11201 TaxID=1729650 RepID=UPI00091B13BD|nr:DUF1822 family protein [Planktothrix sp. PCC 11201]SKB13864.1 conserved hypothetical protein [Planktothrix sp. PCC 11201]
MTLNFDDLTAIYPEQIWIELPPEEQEKARQQTQNYSNSASFWNAYMNSIALQNFAAWVKADPDIQDPLKVWPSQEYLPTFWEIVNGTKLTLGDTQFVLIPSDKINVSEFQVPQEWVDIPNWIADYYVAIQIGFENNWMRVYGYTTYQKLKIQGKYDLLNRTYALEQADLVEDLNIMWVARELFSAQKLQVKPLPKLSAAQTEKFLDQLAQFTNCSPRLVLKFEDWAALITNDSIRQQLYQKRLLTESSKCSETSNPVVSNSFTPIKVNDLSLWLQNVFELGWQSLDALFGSEPKTLAYQFRTDSILNEFRVKTAKLIDLGMELKGISVILLVGLALETEQKVGIRVQLHPTDGETYLPPNLKLSWLTDGGVMRQEVQSRNHDNYIQLKRFRLPTGKGFSIQISFRDATIKEDFIFYQAVASDKI